MGVVINATRSAFKNHSEKLDKCSGIIEVPNTIKETAASIAKATNIFAKLFQQDVFSMFLLT